MVGQGRAVVSGSLGYLVEEPPILQRRQGGSGAVRSAGRKLQVDLLDVVEPLLSGAELGPGQSSGMRHKPAGLHHLPPSRRQSRPIEAGVRPVQEGQVPPLFPWRQVGSGSLPIPRPSMDPVTPFSEKRIVRVLRRECRQRRPGPDHVALEQEGPDEVGVGRVGGARSGNRPVVEGSGPLELFLGHVGIGQVVQSRGIVWIDAKHTVVSPDDGVPVPGDDMMVGGLRDEALPLGEAVAMPEGRLQGLHLPVPIDAHVEEGDGQLAVRHGESRVHGYGLFQEGQGA